MNPSSKAPLYGENMSGENVSLVEYVPECVPSLYDSPLNWESANEKIKREETANFSRAFYFRVFPAIWEPAGTG